MSINGNMVPVLIVFMVMAMLVLRSRYRYLGKQGDAISPEEKVDNLRLREEVQALKDRVKVLERIAIEKEDTLTRQIEELRDR